MVNRYIIVTLILECVITLLGTVFNSFIVFLSFRCWVRNRKQHSLELILIFLGLSNISSGSLLVTDHVCLFTLVCNSEHQAVVKAFRYFIECSIVTSFWFTAWLCIFYCVKIMNVQHVLLLWLKTKISQVLPWMFLGSVLAALLTSPPALTGITVAPMNSTEMDLENQTIKEYKMTFSLSFQIYVGAFGYCMPLLVVTLSVLLIITSLCQHVRHMALNVDGFHRPRMDIHIRAAMTVVSLWILYFSFYLAIMLTITGSLGAVTSLSFPVLALVTSCYSPVQAWILILGNSKLKESILKFLGHGRIQHGADRIGLPIVGVDSLTP
ncbi:taste receptor type 2 member 1-like [Lissotriton helveticus]